MSKKAVVKSRKAGLSQVGQQIATAKDAHDLAFAQIKDLVFLAKSLAPWKSDQALGLYIRLIMATIRQKGDNKKKYVLGHCEPYQELYKQFKQNILDEDISFLVDKTIKLQVGKQQAFIELSKIYKWCMDNNQDDHATDIEAKLFHIFKNLATDADEKMKLKAICDNFEVEEDRSMQDAIGSIVKKVQGTVGNIDANKPPSVETLAPLIQALVGDPAIHGAMGNLAQNLMNGKTDIAGLVNNVKKSVVEQSGGDNSDADEDGDTEGGTSDAGDTEEGHNNNGKDKEDE